MNKKILISILLIFLMIFVINTTNTYAAGFGEVILDGDSFIQSGNNKGGKVNTTLLKAASDNIYNTLLILSFVVVAIVGITLGMKFMMAGVEEKAEVKKSLVVFVIGTCVVYASFGIWYTLVSFLSTL